VLSARGANPTYIEDLAGRLESDGYDVTIASTRLAPMARLADQVRAVATSPRRGCIVLDLYSSPKAFHGALVVAAACRLLRRRYVVVLRGGELPRRIAHARRRLNVIVRGAAAVTAPSPYLARAFEELAPVEVIPNVVDIGSYPSRVRERPEPSLLFLRAFHEMYGCITLVEAFAKVVEQRPDATLEMIGPDKDGTLERCEIVARDLGVEDRVVLRGRIPKADIPALGRDHDVFVNPTDADNTPVSVIEALAMGMCVVSTNVGGLPDLLDDGVNAVLVEPGDAAALADAILRVLNDSDLAERISTGARRLATTLDWEAALPQWRALIADAMPTVGEPEVQPVTYIGNFLSSHGFTPTYAEELVPRLRAAGYDVTTASHELSLVRRIVDELRAVITTPKRGCVVIDMYSSAKAFHAAAVNALVCRALRRPYVVVLHGGKLPDRIERSRHLTRLVLSGAAAVTAPSSYLARASEAIAPVTVIPNGVDTGAYPHRVRARPAPRLVYLRSFERIYGCTTLVEAFPMVLNRYPEATLEMIGPDKDGSLETCRAIAERLGVGDRVLLRARISKSDVARLGDDHDVFVNPTYADNAPVSVIEAMAMGMCVVSTNAGGLPDLLKDGTTAVLVEPGSPSQLADAILRVLDDTSLARGISAGARQVAETMDWSVVVPAWDRLLRTVTR